MIRRALLALTAILPLTLGMAPAHADPDDGLPVSDVVSFDGSGTIDPGLPCAVSCTIRYDFTAIFAGDEGVAITDCEFNGTGGADTLVAGAGGGTFTCDDGTSGAITFSRVESVVTIGGHVRIDGECHTVTASGEFVPEDFAPTQRFLLGGAGILADAEAWVCQ